MDDDLVVWLILLLVVGIGGWFLGVRGYFKSRRALREIADLRRQIATAASAQVTAPEPSPTSVPTFVAQPTPEPEPVSEPELVPADSEPEPAPEPVAAMPEPAKRPDFETLLTTRWGVWLGSGALLLAGVFLIRYAVDEGLLGPATRCALAALLGIALLVGAEWLRRREALEQVLKDRAAPGLAAGGVAILFGAAYGAGVLYDLVPPLIGFALMAAASFIGMAVSLRHGQLVGAVGIAGAFVSPALVQTQDPSLPGLFLYLLLVTTAALAVVRYTAWIWLGWATTIAGAIWVLLGLATGAHGEIWAAALFVPAAAALNLALLPPAALEHPIGRYLSWVPCAALGAVGLIVQLAVTEWSTRTGILLLAPIMIVKAAREPRLAWLPYLSALLILLMLASWSLDLWARPDFVFPPEAWVPPDVSTFLWTSGFVAAGFAVAGLWFERDLKCRVMGRAGRIRAGSDAGSRLRAGGTIQSTRKLGSRGSCARGWSECRCRRRIARARCRRTSACRGACRRCRCRAGIGMRHVVGGSVAQCCRRAFLPALAWVEARADLPPLRQVALAVAAFVLVRLFLNHYVVNYAFGEIPLLNGLLAAYGIPAALIRARCTNVPPAWR